MTRQEKRELMLDRIRHHGQNLLAIFPQAREQDPDKLCRKLRRLEMRGERHAEALCNDPGYAGNDYSHSERVGAAILADVHRLLGSDRPWLNQDPRGYALKVDLEPGERLHTDWGGYGIIAPDFSPED